MLVTTEAGNLQQRHSGEEISVLLTSLSWTSPLWTLWSSIDETLSYPNQRSCTGPVFGSGRSARRYGTLFMTRLPAAAAASSIWADSNGPKTRDVWSAWTSATLNVCASFYLLHMNMWFLLYMCCKLLPDKVNWITWRFLNPEFFCRAEPSCCLEGFITRNLFGFEVNNLRKISCIIYMNEGSCSLNFFKLN